jgi:hypothetical protein
MPDIEPNPNVIAGDRFTVRYVSPASIKMLVIHGNPPAKCLELGVTSLIGPYELGRPCSTLCGDFRAEYRTLAPFGYGVCLAFYRSKMPHCGDFI